MPGDEKDKERGSRVFRERPPDPPRANRNSQKDPGSPSIPQGIAIDPLGQKSCGESPGLMPGGIGKDLNPPDGIGIFKGDVGGPRKSIPTSGDAGEGSGGPGMIGFDLITPDEIGMTGRGTGGPRNPFPRPLVYAAGPSEALRRVGNAFPSMRMGAEACDGGSDQSGVPGRLLRDVTMSEGSSDGPEYILEENRSSGGIPRGSGGLPGGVGRIGNASHESDAGAGKGNISSTHPDINNYKSETLSASTTPRNSHGLVYSRRNTSAPSMEAFTPQESLINNGKSVSEEGNIDGWTTVTRKKHFSRSDRANPQFQPPPTKRINPLPQRQTFLRQERPQPRDPPISNHRPHQTAPPRQTAPPPPSIPRFTPGATPKSWKDICSSVRNTGEDCILEYIEPLKDNNGKHYAQISEAEIEENVKRWENTLVGYVLGGTPYYSHIKASVTRMWKPAGNLQVYTKENGYFYFNFSLAEDCNRVLQEGPWHFDGRLIVLRKWSQDVGLGRDLLSSVPVWVRFPKLHLSLWSKKVISKAASLIGKPLYMDRATAREERIGFARCFVEIDAGKALPSSVTLAMATGELVDIQVEYEWVPPRCSHCVCFGHVNAQCPAIRIWREKPPSNNVSATENEVPTPSPSSLMDIETPSVLEQPPPPDPLPTGVKQHPSKQGKEKLAEAHFEMYGVQSDFIEESDTSADDIVDSEVEEEIAMEEEPNQPPSPIAVTNPEWTVDMERALKRGEERIAKNKDKNMKNFLGLKKPLKEAKKTKDKEPKKGKEKILHKPR